MAAVPELDSPVAVKEQAVETDELTDLLRLHVAPSARGMSLLEGSKSPLGEGMGDFKGSFARSGKYGFC
jgi:hypothetical protein